MRHLPATLFAILLAAFEVAADPNEAPDIRALVESELGNGLRLAELTITTEEFRRDGSGAIYQGEFAAAVVLPVTLYHEIGHGDGYRLVGKLLERGETIPAFGSAVAVYSDGRWAVEISLLDLQLPGGHPFSEFRSPGTVVLEAGTNLVDRFLAQREIAFRNAEALRVQDARVEATETAALLARALADVEERDASLADALAALERSEASGAETAASLADARAELGRARSGAEADAAVIRELLAQADSAQAELDAREAARLAEAAIAAALRERLRNSDAELTALSLRLEEARKDAEETLALLAAANAAEEELNARLAEAVAKLVLAEGLLEEAEAGRDGALAELALLAAARDRLLDEAAARRDAEAEAERRREEAEAGREEALAELALLAAARDRLRNEAAARRDAEAGTAASLAETRDRLRDEAADAERLREELAAALAARLAAERAGADAISERDRRQALLDAAGRRLSEEREISSRAQREVALLNAQVAALRGQLAELSRLLDSAEAQDRASRVRIEALGSRLNQALARAAAEQRRRAELEAAEAERLRREKAALDEEVVDLAAYRSEFFGTLRQVLGDREGVRVVGDRFLFPSEVLFESGSATLRPEGRASIAEVAGILVEVADEIPPNLDWVLRVDGHTDNAPVVVASAFADNWELSAGRALSVVKYMTEELDFPPERLAAAGFGEYRPVNPENSDAARAQNRRIELKLTER